MRLASEQPIGAASEGYNASWIFQVNGGFKLTRDSSHIIKGRLVMELLAGV